MDKEDGGLARRNAEHRTSNVELKKRTDDIRLRVTLRRDSSVGEEDRRQKVRCLRRKRSTAVRGRWQALNAERPTLNGRGQKTEDGLEETPNIERRTSNAE